jgi:hypothetical protein
MIKFIDKRYNYIKRDTIILIEKETTMCDKIDGWNPADIEAGGNGIEGYQAMMQGRQGGVLDLGKKYVKMNQNAIHNANKYLLTEKLNTK